MQRKCSRSTDLGLYETLIGIIGTSHDGFLGYGSRIIIEVPFKKKKKRNNSRSESLGTETVSVLAFTSLDRHLLSACCSCSCSCCFVSFCLASYAPMQHDRVRAVCCMYVRWEVLCDSMKQRAEKTGIGVIQSFMTMRLYVRIPQGSRSWCVLL